MNLPVPEFWRRPETANAVDGVAVVWKTSEEHHSAMAEVGEMIDREGGSGEVVAVNRRQVLLAPVRPQHNNAGPDPNKSQQLFDGGLGRVDRHNAALLRGGKVGGERHDADG